MRIGLFGGSFDPVHLGHLLVGQAAREEIGLDRLYFIPAAQSPFKPDQQPAPATDRLRMLRLALAGQPWCEVDDQELHRSGPSFTITTVRDYARRFPSAELFWLIGLDHVATLPQWRDAAALGRLVEFVVIPRPAVGLAAPVHPAATPDGFRLRRLSGTPFAVSSSDVRARAKAGRPVHLLVPPAVEEAIRNNRLYL